MLFVGKFERAVDDKLRVAIPKHFRVALAGSESGAVYMAPGTDGSVAIYSEADFRTLTNRMDQASPTAQDVRAFMRMFFARVQSVELDSQGRVRVPAELAQAAGITKEAVLVGVRDHLELWDRARWDKFTADHEGRFDELAESALK